MAPYSTTTTTVLSAVDSSAVCTEEENEKVACTSTTSKETQFERGIWGFQTPLKWGNIIAIAILHLFALNGLLTFPYIYKLRTFFFGKL